MQEARIHNRLELMRGTLAALATVVVLMAAQNVVIARFFPQLPRLPTDFSAAYLQRELRALRAEPDQTLFLGDSVLWGYGLQPQQTAVSLLASRGCACRNLSFKAGSPPNYYVLVRLIEAAGVRPAAVVLEINQKVFSQTDSSYETLHPTLAALSGSLLTPADRAGLAVSHMNPAAQSADRALSSVWAAYAMRTDIREAFIGERDAVPPRRRPTAADFAGAYDLTPLSEKNIGVRFLEETVQRLRRDRIPVVAFMTPTNHALLGEFIDAPEYRANSAYLRRLLEREGVQVADLDRAIPARYFFDNDHMTPDGQHIFARILEPYIHSSRVGARF